MQKGIPIKQRVKQILEAHDKDDLFFTQLSNDELVSYKIALASEAISEKNQEKKKKMQLLARQAQYMINYNKSKVKERIEQIGLTQQIKQGAQDINSTQILVTVIVALLSGLLTYFKTNQGSGWFATTASVCFFVFLIMLLVIIGYNCSCRRKIEKQGFAQLKQDEIMLNQSLQK